MSGRLERKTFLIRVFLVILTVLFMSFDSPARVKPVIQEGHSGWVNSVAFSPDGKLLASGSDDNTIKLWDVKSGKTVATLYAFLDASVAITPEGYFTGTGSYKKYIHFVDDENLKVYTDEEYYRTFHRPDFIVAALEGRSIETKKIAKHEKRKTDITVVAVSPPAVFIDSPDDGSVVDTDRLELRVVVKSKSPVRRIDIFVNGKKVAEKGEKSIKRKKESTTKMEEVFNLNLRPGRNQIKVVAYNECGRDEETVNVTFERRDLPRLFLLSIGAEDYRYLKGENLKYAADDAIAIAKAFREMEGKLFSKVYTKVLAKGGDLEPTRDNIIDSLDFISQAGQYDYVILFISGHAINEDGIYYFLPEDARVKDKDKKTFRKSSLVKWSDIEDELLDLPSKVVVLLDTCHSATFFSGGVRAPDFDRIQRRLEERGIVFIASSGKDEFSFERDEWKHGAFTYAILKGLEEGEADTIKDGIIKIKELDLFISEYVPEITGGKQHPRSRAGNYEDFVVWKIDTTRRK